MAREGLAGTYLHPRKIRDECPLSDGPDILIGRLHQMSDKIPYGKPLGFITLGVSRCGYSSQMSIKLPLVLAALHEVFRAPS
jgi:hypothetical protein